MLDTGVHLASRKNLVQLSSVLWITCAQSKSHSPLRYFHTIVQLLFNSYSTITLLAGVAVNSGNYSGDLKDATNTSTSSSISTAYMEAIVNKLKNLRNRNSTRMTYYTIWKKFNEFFVKLDQKPETWEQRLVLFVGFLVESNKKSSTIKSYISAICSVLKKDGETLNEDIFLLNSLTRACKYKNDKIQQRFPIRKGLLSLILQELDHIFQKQPYLHIMYRALFITTYFGLFHVGELKESSHVVKVRDVHVGRNKKKMMFVLHTSKTHWTDVKPQIIKIHSVDFDITGKRVRATLRSRLPSFCPFTALQKYVNVRKSRKTDNEQFFVFRDLSPVKPVHFRRVLKQALSLLHLDSSLYNMHSFRIGRSCDLYNLGVSIEMIRKIASWHSTVIYDYLRN